MILCLMMILIFIGGCTKKQTDNSSSSDIKSSSSEVSTRTKKVFESYHDYIIATKEENDYKYKLVIYFVNNIVYNVVSETSCPNEGIALDLFTSLYNSSNIFEVVRNKTLISYDYKQGKSIYYGKTLNEVFTILNNDKYKTIYNSDALSSYLESKMNQSEG